MKSALAIMALLTFNFALAQEFNFNCAGSADSQSLILTENTAQFNGITFLNYLPVKPEFDVRTYSFINDPWMRVRIPSEMLQGHNGSLELEVMELKYGQTETIYYSCTASSK